MMSDKNLFTSILKALNVKFTYRHSNKLYKEHPHKNNLFGLSSMLSEYQVENAGLQIDKKDLELLETPFIAQAFNDLVLVEEIRDKQVKYLWRDVKPRIDIEKFVKNWTGVVLVAEKSDASREPEYTRHQFQSLYFTVLKILLLLSVVFLAGLIFRSFGFHGNLLQTLVPLLLNIAGIVVCVMLVQKEVNVHSRYADKICSLFKKSDCNNILESNSAKLFGLIGWSEVGLGYFISNLIIILFAPGLYLYCVLINIVALPYSFWSVWYQWFKAKQWCPLCLMVQALLWSLFIGNLALGSIALPQFAVADMAATAAVYLLPFTCISLLIPVLQEYNENINAKQEMNSLRMKSDIFSTMLHKKERRDFGLEYSDIILGNPGADLLVTILTNPHCNPCARMHKRVENVLAKAKGRICVQYVFSSFYKMEDSAKFLIGVYQNFPKEEALRIYDEWFAGGKHDRDAFFAKYPQDLTAAPLLAEFEKHVQWKENSKLEATPIVLINGYELPMEYMIEDILYFMDMDFNS